MVHVMKNKSQLKQSTFYSHKFNKIYNNRLVHKYLRGNSFYTPSLSRNRGTGHLDKTHTVLNY